ncbi:hypothetical protein [Mangrovimonas sp. YM274]|uniref:hypothetical protein n=1 Tax=Mangrovimonas sp. YM274 TaxID=3070660 RepID=UPI0027DC5C15|nr:hypothetical protein [Mangrovimonas sp. YM274]WMI67250.1 hypothetical protein RBH95_08835 [Mangrovimonas sp. YM274]
MMKIIYTLFSCLIFTSCFNIERNCNDYKTGTFQFNYMEDGVEKTGKFVRTEAYSIDYFEGKIDSSSVRWINDCEFILTNLHPKSNQEKRSIHMKIISTSKNSYTFEYKYAVKEGNRPDRVVKGIAKKIE